MSIEQLPVVLAIGVIVFALIIIALHRNDRIS